MSEIPLVTKDALEALPHDVVVDIVLKLQQVNLMQDDQINMLNRLVALQRDLEAIRNGVSND
jgi:hypothetical protein